MSHTPGPWVIGEDGWITNPNADYVTEYRGCGSHECNILNPKDALLIAAAPDLLEVVATYLSMETHIKDGVSPLIDMARAAYNKAVGK